MIDFPSPPEIRRRLDEHLRMWLGSWPPRHAFEVVESEQRALPGWDGKIHRVVGVASPAGTILSVPPGIAGSIGETREDAAQNLGPALGVPRGMLADGVFRWCQVPPPPSNEGVWLPVEDPRIPLWLHPFGSPVLVALDSDGSYMAGVGIKRHNALGQEIAVGTDPDYRGRGLARRLVARAAREITTSGAAATYLHEGSNIASAHVAEASGFPDRRWRILGFWEM